MRAGAPGWGRWPGVPPPAADRRQLWIPAGFAHGFCVTSDAATVGYKCTDVYVPGTERCLIWNDPALAIPWPVREPIVSAKDAQGCTLRELERAEELPPHRA